MPEENEDLRVPDVPDGAPSPEWISTPAAQQLITNIVAGWWQTHPDDILTRRMERSDLVNAIWKRLHAREPWRTWKPEGSTWRAYLIDTIKREIGNERRRYMGNPANSDLGRQTRKMFAVKDTFEQRNGRPPTIDELADATGFTAEKVRTLMQANNIFRASALSDHTDENAETDELGARTVADAFGASTPTPEEQVVGELAWLPAADRDLLMRWKVDGEPLETIAASMGISRATAHRRLKAIQHQIEARGPEQRDEL